MLRCLRHPKTTQEKRQYYRYKELLQDYPFLIRGKRSPRMLVDSYDDIPKNDYCRRSWKKYRKTQYKVSAPRKNKSSKKFSEHVKRKHDEHVYCNLTWRLHKKCSKCRKVQELYYEKIRELRNTDNSILPHEARMSKMKYWRQSKTNYYQGQFQSYFDFDEDAIWNVWDGKNWRLQAYRQNNLYPLSHQSYY